MMHDVSKDHHGFAGVMGKYSICSFEDVINSRNRIRRVSIFPEISLDQDDFPRVYIFADLAGG